MSDFEAAMKWFKWAAGAGNQFGIVNSEVERLKEESKELTDLLQGEIDKINMPCAVALDTIWKGVMPKGYGPWEYPAFAARHIIAEFNDRRAK